MRNTLGIISIIITAACFLPGFSASAEDVGLVISVKTKKAEINWKSWSTDNEPIHIKADHDDAIVIFRFEQLPEEPQKMRVTSNAAVYVETDSGFTPITERAKENPKPDIKLKPKD